MVEAETVALMALSALAGGAVASPFVWRAALNTLQRGAELGLTGRAVREGTNRYGSTFASERPVIQHSLPAIFMGMQRSATQAMHAEQDKVLLKYPNKLGMWVEVAVPREHLETFVVMRKPSRSGPEWGGRDSHIFARCASYCVYIRLLRRMPSGGYQWDDGYRKAHERLLKLYAMGIDLRARAVGEETRAH